jgi:mRNA interferase HigB
MQVISKKRLRQFWEKHPASQAPLAEWYKVVRNARWTKFSDVRATYPSADAVGRCIVFNIGGNKYRLIVIVSENWHKVFVRFVLTHREYDEDKWKSDCVC